MKSSASTRRRSARNDFAIRPISYLKAHAAEIVRTLGVRQEPLIITQNGEAKVVMQDIDSYENMQETVALLKVLALGNRQIEGRRGSRRRRCERADSGAAIGSRMSFLVQLTNDTVRELDCIAGDR